MDNKSKTERSANMRAIRSTDTKPEIIVRRLLFADGFRFRLHVKTLPGKPDIVLPKWKTVVFVNGCFWHVHQGCPRSVRPSSNADYWNLKLSRNQKRDREEHEALISAGWRVLVVWECACGKKTRPTLQSLMHSFIAANDGPQYAEIGRMNANLYMNIRKLSPSGKCF